VSLQIKTSVCFGPQETAVHKKRKIIGIMGRERWRMAKEFTALIGRTGGKTT